LDSQDIVVQSEPDSTQETLMLRRSFAAGLLFSAVGLTPLSAAKPGGCTDIATQWTVNDYYTDGTTLNAIRGDAAGAYKNGQSGVTATIQICYGNNDAVLMTGSSRRLSFNFGHMLASNANTPSWATGIVTGSGGTLHIRNLTFVPTGYDRAQEYVFTTWAGSILPVKGWNFMMKKPVTDASSGDPKTDAYVAAANSPFTDSPVVAHHCPANSSATTGPCTGVIKETWFVYPDSSPTTYTDGSPAPPTDIYVGALLNTQKSNPVNAGQFSMPFYLTISLQ
jgi:hypothetical protein